MLKADAETLGSEDVRLPQLPLEVAARLRIWAELRAFQTATRAA